MSEVLQVLGLCRFSVPSDGGFQQEHATPEARRAALYAPERLNDRLAWFQHVCLPSLRDQTDKDFLLVLLIGEDLPQPWRGRLEALVADVPQIVIEETAPGHHRRICAAAMRRHVAPGTTLLAQFRMDDDDAVAVNFVERLRQDLFDTVDILRRKRQYAIDYGRGIVLSWRDRMLDYSPRLTRLWTPALVMVNRPEEDRFILDAQHNKMWWYMPVVSQTDQVMFVRGDHGGNDSSIPKAGREVFELPEDRFKIVVKHRFHIDLTAFARALLDNETRPG